MPGGTSVQEAVSSSGNPTFAIEVEAGSGGQSPREVDHLMPDQSELARVLHTCPSPRRPQAQVRSMQQQEQVSYAAPQRLQAGHGTPIISIKQEPCDLQFEDQRIFATTHTDGHSDTQSAVDNQTNATDGPSAHSGLSVVAEWCRAVTQRSPAGGEPKPTETSTTTVGIPTKDTVFQPNEEATSRVVQPLQEDDETPTTASEMAIKTLDNLTDTQYKIGEQTFFFCMLPFLVRNMQLNGYTLITFSKATATSL